MQGLTSGLPCPASQADALSAERRVSAPSHCVLTLGIALELQPLMSYCARWPARREELWVTAPPLASGICYGQVDMALRVTQPCLLFCAHLGVRQPGKNCPLLLCFVRRYTPITGALVLGAVVGFDKGFSFP